MTEKIAYICDRQKCPRCSSECHHTTDIHHALNFTKQEGTDDCWMENDWIPCSKEMPDEYEEVLTYTNRGAIKIMERVMEWNGYMWKDEADYLHDIDFVQAWMPLLVRKSKKTKISRS